MRKIFLLILSIIPLTVFSQNKLVEGFLNMPFGTDSATVKNVLFAKGATEDHSLTEKDIILFNDFTFSDRKVKTCIVRFFNNKAYEADFLFNDFAENDVFTYYNSLCNDISLVYGTGQLIDNFKDSEGTSSRISRLESGSASCKYLWMSANNNALALYIKGFNNSSVYIELIYQNLTMLNMTRGKNTSDF